MTWRGRKGESAFSKKSNHSKSLPPPFLNSNFGCFGNCRRFCPHCTPANESSVWKRGNIRFLRALPDSPQVTKPTRGTVFYLPRAQPPSYTHRRRHVVIS
jgi:hypothetical protein